MDKQNITKAYETAKLFKYESVAYIEAIMFAKYGAVIGLGYCTMIAESQHAHNTMVKGQELIKEVLNDLTYPELRDL